MNRDEVAIYGKNAALAIAAHRPDAIRRVLHDASARKWAAPLLKAAAERRRPYREVGDAELEKVAGTVHHEGIAVVADPLPLLRLAELLARPGVKGGVLVALDQVGNPHNLGAILRSAAYFGVAGALVPTTSRQATLSAAAIRVAQGGAEVVPVAGVERMEPALRRLRREGFAVIGADAHGGEPLGALAAPVCVVLGNEGEGLAPDVLAACSRRVTIPGTGAVESLNVSVAAGILLASVRPSLSAAASAASAPTPPSPRPGRRDRP